MLLKCCRLVESCSDQLKIISLPRKGTGDIGPFPKFLQFSDPPPRTLEINKENEMEQGENITSSAEVINHLMWMMQRGLTLSYNSLQ